MGKIERLQPSGAGPRQDITPKGKLFIQGCALAPNDCHCGSSYDASTCRFWIDSPFVLELERQLATPNRKKHAYARAFAALHEAGHAVIAYQYIPHASIHIPLNDPLSGYAMHVLSQQEPRAGAATSFAGAVINKMIVGTIEHAAHDLVAGRKKLRDAYGSSTAKDMQHGLLVEVTRELHTNWPSVEAIATAAMKNGTLQGRDFDRAARLAGLDAGVRRQRQLSQVQAAYLNRFSKSPKDLLSKLNGRAPDIWRNMWLERAREV